MTISFVAEAHNNRTNAGDVIINVPSGTADDDVMIAVFYTGIGTTTAPSGWTQIGSNTSSGNFKAYWRLASSEPANYTWSTTSSGGGSGAILTYTGIEPSNPLNGYTQGSYVSVLSSYTGTLPAVTTTVDDAMIVGAVGQNQGAGVTLTPPGGFTERVDTATQRPVAAMDAIQSTAGSSGTPTYTSSDNTSGAVAFTVALRPLGAVDVTSSASFLAFFD